MGDPSLTVEFLPPYSSVAVLATMIVYVESIFAVESFLSAQTQIGITTKYTMKMHMEAITGIVSDQCKLEKSNKLLTTPSSS